MHIHIYIYNMYFVCTCTWKIAVRGWLRGTSQYQVSVELRARAGLQQCTHSARTVHAQCTPTVHKLETLQIPQKMAPTHQTKKKLVSDFFIDCMPFQRITCYLHHLMRVHCGVHCGVHCACTVKTHASVYSAPSSASSCPSIHCFPLGELACPLEHSCEPWCLPLHAPWRACVPSVGTCL